MSNSDPTPHGYTWSPLLFFFPTAVIAFGFLPREEVKLARLKLTGSGGRLAKRALMLESGRIVRDGPREKVNGA